jgi:hypothetical protein
LGCMRYMIECILLFVHCTFAHNFMHNNTCIIIMCMIVIIIYLQPCVGPNVDSGICTVITCTARNLRQGTVPFTISLFTRIDERYFSRQVRTCTCTCTLITVYACHIWYQGFPKLMVVMCIYMYVSVIFNKSMPKRDTTAPTRLRSLNRAELVGVVILALLFVYYVEIFHWENFFFLFRQPLRSHW